jgi:signal transduction histidine kinase
MGEGLRAAVARQAALEQERRLLIGTIAHDLRTPLFALRGYLEGLEQGLATTPEKIARYLAVCREQAAVLDQRITALFDYARLEYLAQPLRHETIHWPDLIERVIERIHPSAERKGVSVHMFSSSTPCMLEGDPQLLMRMLENILDNAVRYTPPGGTIDVQWRMEAGQLCFSVADNGTGIAPADLPHVFVPMYRGDPARTGTTGGAGLGLAIAQRIAQAHSGHLSAANRATGGVEVTGWLAHTPSTWTD